MYIDLVPEPIRSMLIEDTRLGVQRALLEMAQERERTTPGQCCAAEKEEDCSRPVLCDRCRQNRHGRGLHICGLKWFIDADADSGSGLMAVLTDRMGTEPLSDERLAEIEEYPVYGDISELLAEVRRLRRALQLSEASRGVPLVGQD